MNKTLKKIRDLYDGENLRVFYIKLGSGGNNAFNKQHILDNNFYIGFRADYPDILDSLNHKNKTCEQFKILVKDLNLSNDQAPRSLGIVYEDNGDILWITELNGIMYFGFTDEKSLFQPTNIENLNTTKLTHGAVKKMVKWMDQDVNGNKLYTNTLSGKISKTFKTRGTVAEIKSEVHSYLIKRIFLEKSDEKIKTEELLEDLRKNLKVLIQQLNETDFEVLVEMIFLEKGYKKTSKTCGNERNYDLAFDRPFDDLCKLPTFIQIKAKIDNNKQIKDVFDNFIWDKVLGGFNKTGFIVVGTLDKKVTKKEIIESGMTLKVLDIDYIVDEVINFGLYHWIIERSV